METKAVPQQRVCECETHKAMAAVALMERLKKSELCLDVLAIVGEIARMVVCLGVFWVIPLWILSHRPV